MGWMRYMKYAPDIQDMLLPPPRESEMMSKLAARVVWSIKATKSTVEHARKIWRLSLQPVSGVSRQTTFACYIR